MVEAENKSFWCWRMRSHVFALIVSTFNVTEKFLLSVHKLSIFFLLNNWHFLLEICYSLHLRGIFSHEIITSLMHFFRAFRLANRMQPYFKCPKITISFQLFFFLFLMANTGRLELIFDSWRRIIKLICIGMNSNPSFLAYHPDIDIVIFLSYSLNASK